VGGGGGASAERTWRHRRCPPRGRLRRWRWTLFFEFRSSLSRPSPSPPSRSLALGALPPTPLSPGVALALRRRPHHGRPPRRPCRPRGWGRASFADYAACARRRDLGETYRDLLRLARTRSGETRQEHRGRLRSMGLAGLSLSPGKRPASAFGRGGDGCHMNSSGISHSARRVFVALSLWAHPDVAAGASRHRCRRPARPVCPELGPRS